MKKFIAHSHARVTVMAALGAATLAFFSVNASAQLPAPQQRVDFDDLDLSKSKDTQRLYSRLRNASMAVCSEFANRRGTRMRDRHRECVNNALSDAIETIGNSSLAALHASKEIHLAQRKANGESQS